MFDHQCFLFTKIWKSLFLLLLLLLIQKHDAEIRRTPLALFFRFHIGLMCLMLACVECGQTAIRILIMQALIFVLHVEFARACWTAKQFLLELLPL